MELWIPDLSTHRQPAGLPSESDPSNRHAGIARPFLALAAYSPSDFTDALFGCYSLSRGSHCLRSIHTGENKQEAEEPASGPIEERVVVAPQCCELLQAADRGGSWRRCRELCCCKADDKPACTTTRRCTTEGGRTPYKNDERIKSSLCEEIEPHGHTSFYYSLLGER